ncbi:TraR/DksA family transcriptional regulator [Haloactinomyces albus]|uniref:RNA polymerase-binding transcription factor DksA n=1 Tax=Haloactinomyces albus TaxID=1352928 RepID=A0AAE3ZBT6_9ACTN|nr:TraR/DksA C4-type zinc finger protein [Haloactinomyces albus]MDR7300352.1 RNA polymerase-binding transcription factor DksA [Haloactinomyces albus]
MAEGKPGSERPAEERPPADVLTEQQAVTRQRVAALTRQLESFIESSADTTHDDEHDPEGATIAFERAQLQGRLDQARDDLTELERAAERLRAGTYGICERCGTGITAQRLEALPAARTCIDCASTTRR